MKLERIPHQPGELLEFYDAGFSALGALCERTWHDRLEIVAEGRAARLWNSDGSLHEIELQFTPADTTLARNPACEVFPGCPLTFQLAEALRVSPLPLERFVLPNGPATRAPDSGLLEKLWRAQFPDTARWRLEAALSPDFHFTLVAVVRCEIQAIDQHWSLHRVAVSLADGSADNLLAGELTFHQASGKPGEDIAWPRSGPAQWGEWLKRAIEAELAGDLASIRERQQRSLRREFQRIDDYFEQYEKELQTRANRTTSEASKLKLSDRLAAAKAEHERRRADQLARHEICLNLHVDALLLVAESAWRAQLNIEQSHRARVLPALFVPRLRRWTVAGPQ